MTYSQSTGVYTAASGATSAFAGQTIASATWNSIFSDIQTALTQVAQSNLGGFCVLSSNFTLQDVNTAQQAFNATANGALAVAASTTYEFEAVYYITNTGTTSHTWATLFGGTATLTSIAYTADAYHASTNVLTALSSIYATAATALVVTGASTDANENVQIKLKGMIRVNGAGTLIPQIKLSAATSGTETMLANSFFRCWPLGSNTVTTVGTWS